MQPQKITDNPVVIDWDKTKETTKMIGELAESDETLQDSIERFQSTQEKIVALLEMEGVITGIEDVEKVIDSVALTFFSVGILKSTSYLLAQHLLVNSLEKHLEKIKKEGNIDSKQGMKIQAWIEIEKELLKTKWKDLGIDTAGLFGHNLEDVIPMIIEVDPGVVEILSIASLAVKIGLAGYAIHKNELTIKGQKQLMKLMLGTHQLPKPISEKGPVEKENVQVIQKICLKRKAYVEEQKKDHTLKDEFEKLLEEFNESDDKTPKTWTQKGLYLEHVFGLDANQIGKITKDQKERLFERFIDHKRESKSVMVKQGLQTLARQKVAWDQKLSMFKRGKLWSLFGVYASGTVGLTLIKILIVTGVVGAAAFPIAGAIIVGLVLIVLAVGILYAAKHHPNQLEYHVKGRGVIQGYYDVMVWWTKRQYLKGKDAKISDEELQKRLERKQKWAAKSKAEEAKKSKAGWKDFLLDHPMYREDYKDYKVEVAGYVKALVEAADQNAVGMQRELNEYLEYEMKIKTPSKLESGVKNYCTMSSDEIIYNQRYYQRLKELLKPDASTT